MDMLAGTLAAASALAVSELFAGLSGSSSLLFAVGNVVVERTPGAFVRAVIDMLGTNNKPVLLTTITLTVLFLGALLGPVAGSNRLVGFLALGAFGALGTLAAAMDTLTEPALAVVNGAAAIVVGGVVLSLLLDRASVAAEDAPTAIVPGEGTANRRRFFAFAAATAGGATAAVFTGRRIFGPTVDVEAQRLAFTLPSVSGAGAAASAEGATGLNLNGLSPLVTPNEAFFRIDTALVVPRVDASTWRLKVTGMVDQPYELTFDDLLELVSIEESVTLVCVSNEVGGKLAGNAIWRGVPLADLLNRAGVQAGATQVVGRSVDGFTVGFPTQVALDGRAAMVAVGMNGELLPARHGFPARLVVPGLYGYVSATKWLSEIELTTLEAYDAYWIPRGWAKQAPIKTQSRIDVPRAGERLQPRPDAIAGVAWGGARGISKVEVRVTQDDQPVIDWHEARLSEALSGSSWRQWSTEWDPLPGDYRIEVRATDGEGVTQTNETQPPAPDGATGYHRIRVQVRA